MGVLFEDVEDARTDCSIGTMSTPVPESRAGNKNSGERRGSISKKSDTQSSTREESYEDEEDEEDAISVLDPEEEAKIFRVEESQLQE